MTEYPLGDYMLDEEQAEKDDREARREGQRLAHTFNLREPVGRALAYHRMGYSYLGIVKRMDISETTAKKYLNTVEERFGPRALWAYHATPAEDPLAGRNALEHQQRAQTRERDRTADEPRKTKAEEMGLDPNPLAKLDEEDDQ